MKPKRMTRDEIQRIASSAIDAAVDFITSEIEDDRQKAQRYFDGRVDLPAETGRSKVVATKCRDAVRAVKPSLLRVFMSTDKPVEFVPRRPQDVQAAEQATAYAVYAFGEAGGFRALSSAFHDALIKKTGILKAWWDEATRTDIDEYSDLTDEEFAFIAGDDEVDILEHSAKQALIEDPFAGPVEVILHDAKVSRKSTEGRISIQPVPPEDFFVDQNATCLTDAAITGHKRDMTVGDLIDMGFDWSDVEGLDTDGEGDEADYNRKGYTDEDSDSADPAMKKVTVYEAYMRIDAEGTGVPQLYALILAGSSKKLLRYDRADQVPFAIFEVDPEPHSFFGRSLVDMLIEDQDAGTAMLRGLLDNVSMSNTPGFAFDDQAVNVADLKNNEVGRLVRTKGIPGDKIMPLTVPFTAGTTLPALDYFDRLIEAKTGISSASIGLNPDALQAQTAAAVNATVQGAQGQMEVIARNLAESGMKQLFQIILKLATAHVGPEEMIRVDGRFVPVDPRSWTVGMSIVANVGLGASKREERAMGLRETLQNQLMLMQHPNPGIASLVSAVHVRNVLSDIHDASGIHNTDRYFAPMDPQTEQALMQQAAMSQQAPQDPNEALAQAEIQKAQIGAQAKMQTDQMRAQIDMQKAAMADDRERDKMAQELGLKAADLMGRYQQRVDQDAIRQQQAAPRP